MADSKANAKTKKASAPKSDADKVAALKKQMNEELKSVRMGTATNIRKATQTRREIARLLTKMNQTKEGDKE